MFDMFTWVEKTELWERVTTFARTAAAFQKPFWLCHGSPKCVWQGQGKATAFVQIVWGQRPSARDMSKLCCKKIRELQAELKQFKAGQRKGSVAKSRKRVASEQKSGSHKTAASKAYSGVARKVQDRRNFCRKTFLEEQKVSSDVHLVWKRLQSLGFLEKPSSCRHCESKGLVLSKASSRSRSECIYFCCLDCHRHRNALWFSSFRGLRCTMGQLHEVIMVACLSNRSCHEASTRNL
eukprot:s1299_g12.t1